MSWGAQHRSKDAQTPSAGRGMSENPEPDCCPVPPYARPAVVAVCCCYETGGGGFFVLRHRRYLELSIPALRLAFGVHVRAISCRKVVVE
jgi:hypothetical protein